MYQSLHKIDIDLAGKDALKWDMPLSLRLIVVDSEKQAACQGGVSGKLMSDNIHRVIIEQNRKLRMRGIWSAMRQRCYNPNHDAYARYGGRGITICKRWQSFDAFYLDMGYPPVGKTLDRIDNNLGYSPENCRWATRREQSRNMRNNHLWSAFGEKKILPEWARDPRCMVKYRALCMRVYYKGWSLEDAMTTPTRRYRSIA